MSFSFSKYHGTGNDFILIDNRNLNFNLTEIQIRKLCDRNFGIGADGLLLLNAHPDYDFQMITHNSDGRECTMCGNGGRAMIQFAWDLGLKKDRYRFLAIDGEHEALLKDGVVELKMQNVKGVTTIAEGITLDTGSPHLVIKTKDVQNLDVVGKGRALRNSPIFAPGGRNVNFIEAKDGQLVIRTYERGVENETLSCGTGAVAAAIAGTLADTPVGTKQDVRLQTRGGTLNVKFTRIAPEAFQDIWLIGPAKRVFAGSLEE